MGNARADISVIIPSYDTAALVLQCLESILSRPWRAALEIIVVDSASVDGSASLVAQRFPSVKIVSLPVNRGYGAACNAGAARACGDALLFLNSDTQVLDGALDLVAEAFRQFPEAGAVACHEVSATGETVLGCRSQHTLRSGISFLSGYRLFKTEGDRYLIVDWDRQQDRWVDNVSGFAWAIRRVVFQQLGGFDEKLFLYFEEQDFAIRLQRGGYRIKYLAAVRIAHHGAASSAAIGRWGRRRQWMHSFIHLRRKHGLSPSVLLDRLILYPCLVSWWIGRRVVRGRSRAANGPSPSHR